MAAPAPSRAPGSWFASPLPWRAALLLIAAVALALRLLHLWLLRDAALMKILMGDAQAYDAWARRIASGQWLGTDVFYQSPLYPYAMAVLYAALRPDPWVIRIAQAILGAASCVLIAKAGEKLLNRPAGLIAAALLAIHPAAIFFDCVIQKSSLDLFLVCLTLYTLGRAWRSQTALNVALAGVAAGALILNRENAAVLLLAIGPWLALTARPRAPGPIVRTGAAFVLGAAVVLGPVAVRNKVVGGEFHLTTSQFGPNFYIGNRPGADGMYAALKWGRADARYERQDATELAEAQAGRKLTPAQVSAYWARLTFEGIRADPAGWLRLLGRKWLLTWNLVEIADTEDQYTWAQESAVLRAAEPWLHMGLLFPLAAAGMVLAWREPGARLIGSILLTYALGVTAFYVFARYRYPLLPMVLLLAGAGLASPWGAILRQRRAGLVAMALLAAGAAGWMASRPLLSRQNMLATTHLNLGARLAETGRPDDAERHLRQALRHKPRFVEAYFNLGLLSLARGQHEQAIDSFTQALRLAPGSPEASRGLRDAMIGLQQSRARAATRPTTAPPATTTPSIK